MRFTKNGPAIPDELLYARDEGHVVFFCGAGVSRAKAGLPDFFGLAESVIAELRASVDSDACKVLRKARELSEELDVTGLISADRVFSLLERDFTSTDLHRAVAKCLAPVGHVDRSSHEILLRLARTPSGKTQLVTTNFDRLFENDRSDLHVFQPPRLPNPSKYVELNGIVYLHGRVNADYTGADGSHFVLSGSDFGNAYLSEAWATEFFREIVRKHIVVFVGYSADDPPVHYLLEGLRRSPGANNRSFAFQADESDELIARWGHKGVTPIPYSPDGGHQALWETLEQWAVRADNPLAWRQAIVDRAMAGPRLLQPYERGQVAHVVSSHEGARAFATSNPPADWLCVFDPSCRSEDSRGRNQRNLEDSSADSQSFYSLDSEIGIHRNNDHQTSASIEPPSQAWDAFATNDADRKDLSPDNISTARGRWSSHIPHVPPRIGWLGTWIAHVANQPAAVWWAARQESLHPDFRGRIEWSITHHHAALDPTIRDGWRYILEAWNASQADPNRDWSNLKRDIKRDGWSSVAARRFIDLTKPYLRVESSYVAGSVPPQKDESFSRHDLFRVEVECPFPASDADIPDEWLRHVVRGLRNNIEYAARLSEEVDDLRRLHISPIAKDDDPDVDGSQRTHGISGYVIRFASLFTRLLIHHVSQAREELAAWPSDENTVFARLRLWASGMRELATPHALAQLVRGLSDELFWGDYEQRDLLLVLAARWAEMSARDRKHLEARLLRGPDRWEGEENDEYRNRLTWRVLQRLIWLRDHSCQFSFDVTKEIAERRSDAPEWKDEYAHRAAASHEIRGGFVGTDTGHEALIREPIASLLLKAQELSGLSDVSQLTRHDPFAGLCIERPKRAYLALAHAARQGEYPTWAWKTFLRFPAREKDSANFSAIVAAKLSRLPDAIQSSLLRETTGWFQKAGKALSKTYPESFDMTVRRLIEVVLHSSEDAHSSVLSSGRNRDWVTAAINSPVGILVLTLLNDTRIGTDATAPLETCLERVEELLSLSGDPRRHAICIASRDLAWIYAKDPSWAEEHLLSALAAEDEKDCEAFWAGFLSNPQVTSPEMYLRVKGHVLELAKQNGDFRNRDHESLALLVLLGWYWPNSNGDLLVTDAELRDVILQCSNELRLHVLWRLQRSINDADSADLERWQRRAPEFFQKVWPLQRSVKTSEMTASLCELLLSSSRVFVMLIEAVLPLLLRMGNGTKHHFHFHDETKEIVEAHPDGFLNLLNTVLPDDVQHWPYGTGEALDMIAKADETFPTDARYLEIRRKWDMR